MSTTNQPLTVIMHGKFGELEVDDSFFNTSESIDLDGDDAIHALDQKGRVVELTLSYAEALTAAPFAPEGVTMVRWKDDRGVEHVEAESIGTHFTGPGKLTLIVLNVARGETLGEEPFDALQHAGYGVLDAVAEAVYKHQMTENQQALVAKLTQDRDDDVWVLTRTQAITLVHGLSDLAAKHQKLCEIDLKDGLSAAQSYARDAIEQQFSDLLADVPGVSGTKFLYDPRGETTGIVFADGASNSLSGSWKVPVTTRGYRALAKVDFWTAYADVKVEPKAEPSFVVLRIDQTGNAAFTDGGGREHEIARILDEAAQKVSLRSDADGIILFDLNGNKVGRIAVVDMKPVDTDPSGAPPPGTVRLVLDNTGEALTSTPEGVSRMTHLLRLAATGIREGASAFPLALDENGNRKEYGEVAYAAPASKLQNDRINLADHFNNNGVRKADDGYSGIAEDEFRYVVGAGDFEFGYGLDAGPVYLVNAKGEVANGYEDGDKIVRETYTSILSKDELTALRAVADGSLSFDEFEKQFGDHDADDEPEA